MPLDVRTAAAIRDAMLASWKSRYLARNRDLDTTVDGANYSQADAFALPLEGIQARALAAAKEIFPDTASDEGVLHHAAQLGLTRKPPTSAQLTATVTGTNGSSWTTANTLTGPDGTLYAPTAGGTLVGTSGTVTVQAQTLGTAGNKSAGSVLTWTSPPTGMNATVTVTSVVRVGVAEETIAELAARVLRWWSEPPANFNRAEVVDLAESIPGVAEAYVYPLYHNTGSSPLGPHTPGAMAVLLLGPAGARLVGGGTVDTVKALFFGTGAYAASGAELPAVVDPRDVYIAAPGTDVTLAYALVTLGPGYSWPFAGSYAILSVADGTHFTLTATPSSGVVAGDRVAVWVGLAKCRGGYAVGVVASRAGAVVTLAAPLLDDAGAPTPPVASGQMRPAPANYELMLAALLSVFDRLGPGDVDAALFPRSARWPKPTSRGPATLYDAALVAALLGVPGLPSAPAGVPGVIDAQMSTPGANLAPTAALRLIVPGEIRFDPL